MFAEPTNRLTFPQLRRNFVESRQFSPTHSVVPELAELLESHFLLSVSIQVSFVRSDLVFAAHRKVGNRFLLCRLTAISVPRLHRATAPIANTLNQILQYLGTGEQAAPVHPPVTPPAIEHN